MELISHDRNRDPETPIYLSETCYKLTQPGGWTLSAMWDSLKNLHRSQEMSSSSVTFISLVNLHQDEQGICSCLTFFKRKASEIHVVFWHCGLWEGDISPFWCFSLCPFKECIDLSDARIWRVYVLWLLFNCAKHLLGSDFPGYRTVISVTPSLYIMFQRTSLLKVQLVFRYTWQVPQAVVH